MKVIKEVNKERIRKCFYCKSIFTYTMKDVDNLFGKVCCPVCNHDQYPSLFDRKIKEGSDKNVKDISLSKKN